MSHEFSAGDLVSRSENSLDYSTYERVVGLVMNHEKILVGSDPDSQAFMEIVRVLWSTPKMNSSAGISSEQPRDLSLLQASV